MDDPAVHAHSWPPNSLDLNPVDAHCCRADLTGGHLCSGRLGPRPVTSWGPLE